MAPTSASNNLARSLIILQFFSFSAPIPIETILSASWMSTKWLLSSSHSRTSTLISSVLIFRSSFTISPFRDSLFSGRGITPGRTVDIWGLCSGQIIVAITLPPKAGLVETNSLFSLSISRLVQSAVHPVFNRNDNRGAKSLPMAVPPTMSTSGLSFITCFEIMSV